MVREIFEAGMRELDLRFGDRTFAAIYYSD